MEKITRTHRPLILITNDDGIQAKGIRSVAEFLKPLGDIIVVAPDAPRSGQSAAITVTAPLRLKTVEAQEGIRFIRTNGTPVDCVKLAMNLLLECPPDLIVSGINHGSNSGVSELYSGTMGAVFEGTLLGVPSIGFSLCNHHADADFAPFHSFIVETCQKILNNKTLIQGIGLNINFPDVTHLNGGKVCRAAKGHWTEEYAHRVDPHGQEYYWLTGRFLNLEPDADDTDEYWLDRGFASIVPCTPDRSMCDIRPRLAEILNFK